MADSATPEDPTQPAPVEGPAKQSAEKPPSRLMLALSWATALVLAAFGGWIAMRAADGSTPYRFGVAMGTVVAPFLIAAVLRLAYFRLRRGRFARVALRSPWVPLGAALIIALSAAGDIASLAPPPAVEAETAMHVRSPFTLRETDAATLQQIEQGLREDQSVRSIAVREVIGDDGSVSLLLAADARLRPGDIDEAVEGLQGAAGAAATIERIGGQDVAIVTGPDGWIGSWIESPLMVQVYSPDRATLQAVIEAVTGSR